VTSVSLSPNTLTGGDPLTFTAVITDAAAGAASNVGVRCLVAGVPLGADRSIAQLAGGASRTLTAQWSAKGQNGPHTLEGPGRKGPIAVIVGGREMAPHYEAATNSSSFSLAGLARPQSTIL
jgi:hypothetical protein